jgi:hypothetical protein
MVRRRLVAAALISLFPTGARALAVVDGDFLDWTFGSIGTVAVTREASGGDPDARLNVTTVSGPTVHGTAVYEGFSTSEALEGVAATLSLDVLSGPGAFGDGQHISLLAEQGGDLYVRGLGVTGFPRSFDTVQFMTTLTAASFSRLVGIGPTTPDFGGGTPTRFGFAASNSSSGTLTQFYDNFSLEIVPEPASATLLMVASLALASLRIPGASRKKAP